jgi:hypothetical protein
MLYTFELREVRALHTAVRGVLASHAYSIAFSDKAAREACIVFVGELPG